MTHEPDDDAGGLHPAGTFVVQLRAGSDPTRERISGRIEHVMSGVSERFESLADVLAFMARHNTPPRRGARR
jgi:hypothetical protein